MSSPRLLVHYNDLKADLDGEMRRISDHLEIPVNEAIWPALVTQTPGGHRLASATATCPAAA